MGKNSFVMYDNWSTLLCGLPDEEAGKLIKAICAYKLGMQDGISDPVTAAMFNMIKDKLDEDAESYVETCKRRAENGKKGAEKRWNNGKEKQKIANAISAMANDSKIWQNMADTDTDTDTDNDINNIKEKESKKKSADKPHRSFVPPTVEEVRDYCQERNNGIDAQSFVDFYDSKGWFVGKNKMKDWRAAVRTWEQRSRGQPKPKIEVDNSFRKAMRESEVVDFGI